MFGKLMDRFTVWLIFKRPASVASYLATISAENTMSLGMTLVEAVMKNDPQAGVRAISKRSGHWGVINTDEEHVHTAECSGEPVH